MKYLMPDIIRWVSPNLKSLILRAGVSAGGQAEWQFAFDQYKATHQDAYLSAMASTRDSSIIYR